MKLGIQIDQKFRRLLKKDRLKQAVECSLSTQSLASEVELGLLITNDETVQKLNREYRSLDETTDVLSFALTEKSTDADSLPFVTPPDGFLHLGEVVISYPQAARQAQENNTEIDKEVALLVIHGTLHLLGYDHDEPKREQEMRALEERILSEVEGNPRSVRG